MDLRTFYAGDARRRHSEELEFGDAWSENSEAFNVAWIAATGEVYATRHPLGGFVALVQGQGISPTRVPHRWLEVEVLGIVEDERTVTSVMSGWPEAMPQADSLAWVRDRLEHAADERSDPPARPSRRFDAY